MFHVESMSRIYMCVCVCVLVVLGYLATCLCFLFYVLVWSPTWVCPSTFLLPLSWATRKKLVQFNHQLESGHRTSWWENAHINHFGCQPEVLGCQFSKHSDHKFPVGNHFNLLIHIFLLLHELQRTSCNKWLERMSFLLVGVEVHSTYKREVGLGNGKVTTLTISIEPRMLLYSKV